MGENLKEHQHPQWGSILGFATEIHLAVLKDELINWKERLKDDPDQIPYLGYIRDRALRENKNKKGNQRSEQLDRIKCAENYKEHLNKALTGDKSVKIHGKRCSVGELVKDALKNQKTALFQ